MFMNLYQNATGAAFLGCGLWKDRDAARAGARQATEGSFPPVRRIGLVQPRRAV